MMTKPLQGRLLRIMVDYTMMGLTVGLVEGRAERGETPPGNSGYRVTRRMIPRRVRATSTGSSSTTIAGGFSVGPNFFQYGDIAVYWALKIS